MSSNIKGQVQLNKLIFTQNWEDPACDEKALQIQPGQTIFTITSGGCNSLGFLRFNPAAVYCSDINPVQNWLMELKQAAFRNLEYNEMLEFIGIRKSNSRLKVYNSLQKNLTTEAQQFWQSQTATINIGLIMNGRYEKFVKIAGALMRLLQGANKTKTLFTLETLEQQKEYYYKRWDNKRWRWVFNTMFNKKRLAKKGLNTDYFHFDDGSSSFSESFYKRAGHAFTDLPVNSNYFFALYLLGHYNGEEYIPEYLKEKNFSSIKTNIDKIIPVSADSKYWLEQQPAEMFDSFALSNICELMDDADTRKLFNEVIRTAKPGAKIIFRNLMIPREVPEELKNTIIKDDGLSRQLQFEDRSFVYGKVAVYSIKK